LRVGVIGTGHVGLVTTVTLADLGHQVVGTDADLEKIDRLKNGIAPFFEPGLQELLEANLEVGALSFTPETSEAVLDADVVFICVGTPPRASGEANLVAVEQAVQAVARHVTGYTVLVQKSTVPVGTAERLRQAVRLQSPDLADLLDVVSNPEFLREGSAIQDSLKPDRILVGANGPRAFEVMRNLYSPLTDRGSMLIETDVKSAELAKHACNAFLALKISYANALARVCELAGADVVNIADIMGSDPRIGRSFLDAGLGFGGYCFPKDVQAFDRLAAGVGYDFSLLREVARINDAAVDAALDKVRQALWNLEDKTVALLGLAFKPGTDDVRFSPALALASKLIGQGARVVGFDPHAGANAKKELPAIESVTTDPYSAARGAHCVVVCTEWDEVRSLDLKRLREIMTYPVIVDGRNVFDPGTARAAGFLYYPTGRSAVG
jgi:UDPglucose 6-dehydrogenase